MTLSFLLVTENITYVRPAEAQYAPIMRSEPPNDPVEATSTQEAPTEPQECFCVTFARKYIPNLPRGDAKNLIPNSGPTIGGVMIMDYYGVGHVAVITGFDKNGDAQIIEANYKKCRVTRRTVSLDDIHIVGYANYID